MINQAARLDNYPIPKIEDLYATLGGGGMEFTKLDLSQAYQQLELDEESKENTPSTPTKVSLDTIASHMALHQLLVFSSARLKVPLKEFRK